MVVLGPDGTTCFLLKAASATMHERLTVLSREAGGIIGINSSTIGRSQFEGGEMDLDTVLVLPTVVNGRESLCVL